MFSKLRPLLFGSMLVAAASQAPYLGELALAVGTAAETSSHALLLAGLCLMAGIARRRLS